LTRHRKLGHHARAARFRPPLRSGLRTCSLVCE
jgi:hypothetical protein